MKMHKITDQQFINQSFGNINEFSSLNTLDSLFLLEILNKKIIELKVNFFKVTKIKDEVDFTQSHNYFQTLLDSLNIQQNNIRVKIESSYLYFKNCGFLWQTSIYKYITEQNIENINSLIECGIIAFDPLKQIRENLVAEFINQPVLISLPKKINLSIGYANKHFASGTRENERYKNLLIKLWENPILLKNTDVLSTMYVLLDLVIQQLINLHTITPSDFLFDVKHYLKYNSINNTITTLHPNSLILGLVFNINHLNNMERNQFLLKLIDSKNTLDDIETCLAKYGVTVVNETLP